MTTQELKAEIALGEDSRRQFKQDITTPDQVASEMVAFLNTKGGRIIIGVRDDGTVLGISSEKLRQINQHLSNAMTNQVRPAGALETETLEVDQKIVLVATIPQGINPPYCDNQGRFWTKIGADKRKIASPEELQRLFQKASRIHADELPLTGTSFDDFDKDELARLISNKLNIPMEKMNMPLSVVCQNMGLMKDQYLTLAGGLLVGKNPQKYAPEHKVHGVAISGTSVTSNIKNAETIAHGSLRHQYEMTMAFLRSNLKQCISDSAGFNTPSSYEIPVEALSEILVNALIHRDYTVDSAIKVILLDDKLIFESPGHLPNSLDVEKIKAGVAVHRNPVLASHAQCLLPYTGIGTGVRRSVELYPAIEFRNEWENNRFIATFARPL